MILRENGRRRRRYDTPVHAVLDLLDWSVADLTRKVCKEMRRKVSRASMQFWAVGQRQIGPKGKSVAHGVQAPVEIRKAAERVTTREAMKRRLGEAGILYRNVWPNVEE